MTKSKVKNEYESFNFLFMLFINMNFISEEIFADFKNFIHFWTIIYNLLTN